MPERITDLGNSASSRKVRLKALAAQLQQMEAQAARSTPIPVVRLTKGRRKPQGLPSDALLIWLERPPEAPQPAEPA